MWLFNYFFFSNYHLILCVSATHVRSLRYGLRPGVVLSSLLHSLVFLLETLHFFRKVKENILLAYLLLVYWYKPLIFHLVGTEQNKKEIFWFFLETVHHPAGLGSLSISQDQLTLWYHFSGKQKPNSEIENAA